MFCGTFETGHLIGFCTWTLEMVNIILISKILLASQLLCRAFETNLLMKMIRMSLMCSFIQHFIVYSFPIIMPSKRIPDPVTTLSPLDSKPWHFISVSLAHIQYILYIYLLPLHISFPFLANSWVLFFKDKTNISWPCKSTKGGKVNIYNKIQFQCVFSDIFGNFQCFPHYGEQTAKENPSITLYIEKSSAILLGKHVWAVFFLKTVCQLMKRQVITSGWWV